MLMFALGVFTLVAIMGLSMACGVWRGLPPDTAYARAHAGFSLLGSGLVIFVALQGDKRLFVNIGMAVVIILLGVVMAIASKKGKPVPRVILATHALLAVACYLILGFFTFNPHATLPIEI
jgi:hypothetical protein